MNQEHKPVTNTLEAHVLGEPHPLHLLQRMPGLVRDHPAFDDESTARITESWAVCASFEPTVVPVEPIDAIAICLDCKNPVHPRHLPRTMTLAVGKRRLIQVRLTVARHSRAINLATRRAPTGSW